MTAVYNKILKLIEKIVWILFTILILIVFAQVFWRYVLQSPIFWAEEFARILFIWLVMLALVISMDEGSQASIDVLTKLMFTGKNGLMVISLFINVCVLVFSGILVGYGFNLSFFVYGQVFPALDIPYTVQYIAVPVSGIFLILVGIKGIFDAFRIPVQGQGV